MKTRVCSRCNATVTVIRSRRHYCPAERRKASLATLTLLNPRGSQVYYDEERRCTMRGNFDSAAAVRRLCEAWDAA